MLPFHTLLMHHYMLPILYHHMLPILYHYMLPILYHYAALDASSNAAFVVSSYADHAASANSDYAPYSSQLWPSQSAFRSVLSSYATKAAWPKMDQGYEQMTERDPPGQPMHEILPKFERC